MAKAAKNIDVKSLIRQLNRGGYRVFKEPYYLNIVGVRNKDVRPTHFDDTMYVFWYNDNGELNTRVYPITTDPSLNYLKKPLAGVEGTAILKQGQYIDSWSIGLHKGKYEALVQTKPVTVYRNYDRNAYVVFDDRNQDTGLFGINIHRAKAEGTTNEIDVYSAGCQVFKNAADFNDFMSLARMHRDRHGNIFTYTLIDEWYRQQSRNRAIILIAAILILAVGITILSLLILKKK